MEAPRLLSLSFLLGQRIHSAGPATALMKGRTQDLRSGGRNLLIPGPTSRPTYIVVVGRALFGAGGMEYNSMIWSQINLDRWPLLPLSELSSAKIIIIKNKVINFQNQFK